MGVSTPTANTQFDSGVEFDAGGAVNYGGPGDMPDYVYLKVYDIDLATVIVAVNAEWDRANASNTWTQPDDALGVSKLHAPAGNPPELIDNFMMSVQAFKGFGAATQEFFRYLKVKGPVMP